MPLAAGDRQLLERLLDAPLLASPAAVEPYRELRLYGLVRITRQGERDLVELTRKGREAMG